MASGRRVVRRAEEGDSGAVSVEDPPGAGEAAADPDKTGTAAAVAASTGAALAAAALYGGGEAGDDAEAEVSQEEMLKQLQEGLTTLLSVVREAQAAELDPVEVLQERQLVTDVVQYALALRALRLEGLFKAALQLLAVMEGVLEPDVSVYSEALGVHVAMGRWTRVMDTFTRMKRQGIRPNLSCYNCVLRAYAESNNAQKAADLLRDMRESAVAPDMTSYELALKASAGKHGEKTLDVLRTMKVAQVTPNAVCYRRAIRAMGQHTMWEKAIDLFDEMRSQNVEIDEFSLNTFLCACMVAPTGGTASSVFKRLEADPGITLSELHYDTVITACEKEGNWPEVVALAARMGARGVDPHLITYSSVLTACVELGKWEAALSLLNSIRNEDTDTGTLAFAVSEVIRGCLNAGKWGEVAQLHTELRRLRRELDSDGPELVDVRGLPPEVAGGVVRSSVREAVQRLGDSGGEGSPATPPSTSSSIATGPQDIIVLVEPSDIVSEVGAPGSRQSKAVKGTPAASAVVVALEELGKEANLQCLTRPFACVRIPGIALESPLLQQRVQKAVSDFTLGAGQASAAEGIEEAGDASTGTPRSI